MGDYMIFKYSNTNKRYHTLDYYYKNIFKTKIIKISLNAGFSCPHLKSGGCIYCSDSGSGEYAGNVNDDLITQFNKVKKLMHKKWPNGKYIGYFQARTNTYAPISILKEKYETILKLENVVGLSIATRPDCISDDCLEYLSELNNKTFLTIELGLQTIHQKTAELINRGHNLACFVETVNKLRARNINVVVHIINGLPYETEKMMLETVKFLNKLDIQGIKFHMLCILKNTKLEQIYIEKPFKILTEKEYIDIVCKQLEYLRPEIVIHRIFSGPKLDELIEPKWLNKRFTLFNELDNYMKEKNITQSDKLYDFKN